MPGRGSSSLYLAPISQLYDEALDDAPNAWITTTFIDGELASTVRVHVASDETGVLPALGSYSDFVDHAAPMKKRRVGVSDALRGAARFARRFAGSHGPACAPGDEAMDYFETDFPLATPSSSSIGPSIGGCSASRHGANRATIHKFNFKGRLHGSRLSRRQGARRGAIPVAPLDTRRTRKTLFGRRPQRTP